MKGTRVLAVLMLLLGLFCWMSSDAMAVSISVDRSLSDWGVDPSVPHWIPGSNSTATGSVGDPLTGYSNGVYYWVEDAVGVDSNGHSGYVEPGYGGQTYDVEALYLAFDDQYVYGAVVTGFPVNGTGTNYLPGDLAFNFGGDGTYEYGVAVTDHDGFVHGQLYKASDWKGVKYTQDPNDFSSSKPWALKSGSDAGAISFSYDEAYGRTVIEVAIQKLLFSGIDWSVPQDIVMHWTMQCGNDAGNVSGTAPVPEPGTILLVGTGLLGLALGSRKKRSK